MRTSQLLLFVALLAEALVALAPAQESAFELPVQLIGFPVIIIAVRLSNFVKKLAYSLNPRTYTARSRRSAGALIDLAMDVVEVEKKLIREFGPHVCIYENVCTHYAELSQNLDGSNHVLDWETIFGKYKSSPSANKQNYLLSVFLGDIVSSPGLCHALAKRGHTCSGENIDHHTISRKSNLTAATHDHQKEPLHSRHRSNPVDSSGHHHEHHSNERVLMDHPAQGPNIEGHRPLMERAGRHDT
ncbi:uncharacterized protein [Anabrus simplex]|uniref:uncharacterized protein n=1 Tax=Anabrus simplex TaxID=316456 RepID=UPI0035A27293